MVRPYDNSFKINGSPVLASDDGADFSTFDIEDKSTGMDESGFLHRTIIRPDVKKWSFRYSVLTTEEYKYMQDLIRTSKPTFKLSYEDENGVTCITTAYITETSVSFYSRRQGLYKNFRFDVLEC